VTPTFVSFGSRANISYDITHNSHATYGYLWLSPANGGMPNALQLRLKRQSCSGRLTLELESYSI
jgi:hypothetical protein